MAVVRNLIIRGGADFSPMNRGLRGAENRLNQFRNRTRNTMDSAANAIGGRGGAFMTAIAATSARLGPVGTAIGLVTAALSGFTFAAQKASQAAMQYEGSIGMLNRTMGDRSDEFFDWMEGSGAKLGIGQKDLAQYGASYSNVLRSMSKSNAETEQSTKDFIKATQIIAGSTGRSFAEVADKISGGLRGETEGIQDIGIQVEVAALQGTKAFRAFAGDKSWEQLDFKTQNLIRRSAILEQATALYGNEIKDNTMTATAQLSAHLSDLGLRLSQAVLPIWNAMLPALNSLAAALSRTAMIAAQFMQGLFGFGGSGAESNPAAATEQTAEAVAGVGDAYTDAGKAAKKASGFLAGFDEINSAGRADAGGGAGAGAGGAGAGAGGFDPGPLGNQKALETPKWMKGVLEKLKPVSDMFDRVKKSGAELWDTIKNAAPWEKWGKVLLDLVKFGAMAIIGSAALALSGALDIVTGAIKVISGVLSGDFTKTWNGVKDIVSGAVDIIIAAVSAFFPGIRDWLLKTKDMIAEKWGAIEKWIVDNVPKIPQKLLEAWNNAVLWTTTKWEEMRLKIQEKWAALTSVDWGKVGTLLNTAWNTLKTNTAVAWENLKLKVKEKWDALTAVDWGAVGVLLNTAWNTLKTNTAAAWENLKLKVSEKWDSITGLKWSKLTETLGTVWDSIELAATNVWVRIKTGLKNQINSIIGMVNTFIRKINAIEIKIPSFTNPLTKEKVGGGTIGMPNIPEIPALKEGGITNGEMIARIGDNVGGQEVVSPLSDLKHMLAEVVSLQMNQSGNTSRGGDVVLQVDGVTFARLMNSYNTNETKRLGGSMITVT